MKNALKVGLNFGLISGVITTLGMLVGLYASTQSKIAVIAGILTIAIADSSSDALGIHVSQEGDPNNSHKEIWYSTISTAISKFTFTITFLIPNLLFEMRSAITASIVWGFLLIVFSSYYVARNREERFYQILIEHAAVATLVLIITYYAGTLIRNIVF